MIFGLGINDFKHFLVQSLRQDTESLLVGRGYEVGEIIFGVEIMMPGIGKDKEAYEKKRDGARIRRRVSVELVIGHLKNDY